MIRHYGKNRKAIEASRTMLSMMVFIIVSSIIVSFLFIIGLGMELGSEWCEDEEINIFVFLIPVLISTFLNLPSSRHIKTKEYKRSMLNDILSMLVWLVFCLFIACNGEESDMDTLAIVYIVISIAIIPIFVVWGLSEEKKKWVVVSNLEKCYLELGDERLTSISFGSVEIPGNGTYFEIAYTDIKNIRCDHNIDPQAGRYYNLFIDHAYGTFKLCIESCSSAIAAINNAREAIAKGEDPFVEEKKEDVKAAQRSGIAGSDIPMKAEKNDAGLICCPTCGRWQGGEHKKCYRCGQAFLVEGEMPLTVVPLQPEDVTDDKEICCPTCQKWQSATNKWCFNCGNYLSEIK